MRDENIRDRIVIGILDKGLSERLQMIPDLTLEMTIQKVRLSEHVKSQQSIVRGGEPNITVEVDEVKKFKNNNFKKFSKCMRCGRPQDHSSKEECPALDSTCFNCKLKGHWSRCCRKKNFIK